MSILVVGSVALDTVKTPLGREVDILGGSATYFSLSASVFGKVSLVAVVGRDFPSQHINLLESKGIDLAGLVVKNGNTFKWEGEYGWDFNSPKTISTCLNVFAEFNPTLPEEYKNCQHIFLANIDPEIQEDVLGQIKSPRLVISDTMNYWIENKRRELTRLLRKVDIFLLNDSELRELSGQTNFIKAAESILKLGPKMVVVKKGEHGAILFSKDSIFSIPAYLMETVVDPTGAGDTFAGGFVGYLSACKKLTQANLRKAIVYGNILASFTVEDFSIRRLNAVSKNDVEDRLKVFKKQIHF